ncbi:MAG: DUF1987 domain-containing protein [Bacteroidia bacterium]|nr:DUF1987 domain-containing protein [Bacteroidia bacterium]
MDTIKIQGSAKTPSIFFDPAQGRLEIKGRSIPENSIEFYKPLLDVLNSYSEAPKAATVADFHLEYFNTSSSKCLLDILKQLAAMHKAGKTVNINWYYESDDRDIEESGEDYQHIVGIPFHFEAKELDGN